MLVCGAALMLVAALRPALAHAASPVPFARYSITTFAVSQNGYSVPAAR